MANTTKSANKKRTNKPNFAERTAKRVAEQNQWQQYNATTKFKVDDLQGCLEELSAKTFPSDLANRQAYQEAIAASVISTLSPEVGILDFWKAIGKAGCTDLIIKDGHLGFYDSKKEKMDITAFTQPIIFEAHSSFYKQRKFERQERIEEARKQLNDLLDDIYQTRKK